MAFRNLGFDWSDVFLSQANTDREDGEYSKGICEPGIGVHEIKSRVLPVVANSESANDRAGEPAGTLIEIYGYGQYPVQVMNSITYTAARENLAATINRVCEDNAPVVITRNRDQAVVMLSLAEYESLQETAHLLRSPANAKRLLKSIESLERGKGFRKKLKLEK
jgi:antitoxin YefM